MMSVVDAAVLLRDARLRAGLSQVELGRRAGVSQSVISAYQAVPKPLSECMTMQCPYCGISGRASNR
jgi:predicted transcriptional regulator